MVRMKNAKSAEQKKNAGKTVRKKKIEKEKIEILIDDAGSGNFTGGMIIGGWTDNIQEYKSVEISPQLYNESGKNIQTAVYDCVKEIVDYFADYKIVSIFLCQSMLFDLSANQLVDRGFVVLRGKIEGELQSIIEYDFMNHLKKLGLPKYVDFFIKMIERDKNLGYRMLNNFCVNFVKVDLQNRLSLCKSQNKLYEELLKTAVSREQVENRFKKKPKLCCNCGRYINDDELYKNSTSNYYNVFYTHLKCAPVKETES